MAVPSGGCVNAKRGQKAKGAGAKPLRLLHLHSSFDPGGKELRAVRLINAFGAAAGHTIVSAQPGATGAMSLIARGIAAEIDPAFPALQGRPLPGRLLTIAKAMAGHDLILTYNFGAMDAVMAHTLFSQMLNLPPLIHHEDGFNQDEIARRSAVRTWYRRIGLGRAAALVVCSQVLEHIARDEWKQPPGRIHRIPNGIATARYAATPRPDSLPRIIKRPGERWVGTMAGLRPVKNLPRLVRAFAALAREDWAEPWQLVICGQGSELAAIRAEADRLDIGHRVHLPGQQADPAAVVGLFDIFALSSDSEQFPLSVVEAMAAGLPVAAMDVGDVRAIVSPENTPFLARDEASLSAALTTLANDPGLRTKIGTANRTRARSQFDEAAMIATYRTLYAQVARHPL